MLGVENGCVKCRFYAVRNRASDPEYDKAKRRCPRPRLTYILGATGEWDRINGRFAWCTQQEEKVYKRLNGACGSKGERWDVAIAFEANMVLRR